jgi:hypothetical protein
MTNAAPWNYPVYLPQKKLPTLAQAAMAVAQADVRTAMAQADYIAAVTQAKRDAPGEVDIQTGPMRSLHKAAVSASLEGTRARAILHQAVLREAARIRSTTTVRSPL